MSEVKFPMPQDYVYAVDYNDSKDVGDWHVYLSPKSYYDEDGEFDDCGESLDWDEIEPMVEYFSIDSEGASGFGSWENESAEDFKAFVEFLSGHPQFTEIP